MNLFARITLYLLVLSTLVSLNSYADVPEGYAWLASQQRSDGSVDNAESLTPELQATLETLLSFQAEDGSATFNRDSATAFISAPDDISVEYIAQAAALGIQSTTDGINLLTSLSSLQNADGGFGSFNDFDSTPLDTSFALIALNEFSQRNSASSAQAVSYLLAQQNSDGGWGLVHNPSSIYTTAITIIALTPYQSVYSGISERLVSAQNYLFSQQSSSAAWDENFITAFATLALAPIVPEPSLLDGSVDDLSQAQNGNGSWNQDPFTTAVAIRAIQAREARQSSGANTQFGAVSGFVFQAGSSQPLMDVNVTIRELEGVSVQTNAEGYFLVPSLPNGNYTLIASKAGFNSASGVATITTGQVTLAGNLILDILPNTGLIRGQIFDAQTSAPLGAAQVSVAGSGSYSATTDASGHFQIAGIVAGDFSFTIEKTGYLTVAGSSTLEAGQALSLRQGILREGAFVDDSPADIIAMVVDGTTNEAISGATLSLDSGLSDTTSTDGTLTLGSVARGSYQATLTATGYAAQTYSINFPAGVSGNLGTLMMYAETAQEAPTDVDVIGLVKDGVTGESIANAQVTLSADDRSVTTSSDGSFTLEGISSTDFQLGVEANGYVAAQFDVQASSFGEVRVVLNLSPPSLGNPNPLSFIDGTVTDVDTGATIPNASITIANTDFSALSDQDGAYALTDIDSLMFTIEVAAPGYRRLSRQIQLSQVGNYRLDVQLETIPVDRIQILSVDSTQSWPANTVAELTVEVLNLSQEAQDVLLIAEVFDANGASVATLSPYAESSTVVTSEYEFLAEETKRLVLPWNTGQFASGRYQVVLRAVEPGSISAGLLRGIVIAEGSGSVTLTETAVISGLLDVNPPLTQAGSTTPVELQAVVRNSGNVPFDTSDVELQITQSDTGELLYTNSASLLGLEIGQNTTLNFGNWVPTVAGNLSITIRPVDSQIAGQIKGELYVGDRASGEFTVDRSVVPEGTQTVRAQISLQGVDTRIGSSTDPLFALVRDAVERGGDYVVLEGESWISRNRCLGCHTQAQSSFGLSSSLDKAPIDTVATTSMFNSIASSQQNQGQLVDQHPQWPIAQTSLGIWAMSAWPDKVFSFRAKYRAAELLYNRRSASGDTTFWSSERRSVGQWWNADTQTTALVAEGFADLLNSTESLDLTSLNEIQFDVSQGFGSGDVQDIEIDANGQVFAVKFAGSIDQIDIGTGEQSTYLTGLPSGITGLALAEDGTFYVVGNNRQLLRVNQDLSWEVLATQSGNLRDVEIGPDGLLYVTDHAGDQILVFDTLGNLQRTIRSALFANPEGLAFDASGNLFVASMDRYSVVRVNSDDSVELYAGSLAYRPSWLGIAANGDLLVSSLAKGSTPDGLYRIGENGQTERVLAGNTYRGFDTYNGDLYVANRSSNQLNRIRYASIDTSLLSSLRAEIPRIVQYLENNSRSEDSDNAIIAMRLKGLTATRSLIDDAAFLADIDAAITFMDELLRQRQNADGGWGRRNGQSSDPLMAALVGIAIDSTEPSPDDSVVRNTIQYLLNTQGSDGSWSNVNNGLGTRLAATSLVMAYMPKALDRLGGIDVELRLGFAENASPTDFSIAPSETSSGPDNTTEYLWSLDGVTANGRNLEFDLELPNLALNETRPAATAAAIEFDNSFTDERLRIDLSIPDISARSELLLTQVTTDRGNYQANENVAITASVNNTGPTVASGDVFISIIPLGSEQPIATLSSLPVVDLVSGGSQNVDTTWDTGTSLAGRYEVRAQLQDLLGRTLSEQSTQITILSPIAAANANVTIDKPTYFAWDNVVINGRTQNTAVNAALDESLMEIQVVDPRGVTIFKENRAVNPLAPTALFDQRFDLALVDAPEGAYTVTMILRDEFSREQLDSDSTVFNVSRNPIQALRGTVSVQADEVLVGDANACNEQVINISATSISDLLLNHQLVDVENQAVLDETTETLSQLSQNETNDYIRNIDTSALESGSYACVLSAELNGEIRVLDTAAFQVIEPPINIAARLLSPESSPRLLALVDPLIETCTANRSVTLEGEFDQSIGDYTEVYAKVFGKHQHHGPKDYELAAPADFAGDTAVDEVNHNNGHPDIAITALTGKRIQITLTSESVLAGQYRLLHYVSDYGWHPQLESGVIDFNCGSPLEVGQTVGELTVVETDTVELLAVNDDKYPPYGHAYGHKHRHDRDHKQAETPALETQHSVLETLLVDRAYTLVDNVDDFETELLSGQYQQYLLLSERQSLDHFTAKLLREAVNRGEGLVLASGLAPRAEPLWEALSIASPKRHHKGKGWDDDDGKDYRYSSHSYRHPYRQLQTEGVRLLESPIATAEDVLFGLKRSLPYVALDQATLAGTLLNPEFIRRECSRHSCGIHSIPGDKGKHKHHHHDKGWHYREDDDHYRGHYNHHNPLPQDLPAVTLADYGQGKAVFIGYDVLAEITHLGLDASVNQHSDLLINSLNVTAPTTLPQRPGSVVPVQLALENLGSETPVTATLLWPLGSQLLDSVPVATTENELAMWTLNLASDQSSMLTSWAIPEYFGLTGTNNSALVVAEVFIGNDTTQSPYERLELTLQATGMESLELIKQDLVALIDAETNRYHKRQLKKVLHWLKKAERFYNKGKLEQALSKLLYATNHLKAIDTSNVITMRLRVDELLWQWGQQVREGRAQQ